MKKPPSINELREKELQKIAKRHDGILKAEDVVEYAKNPTTALHSAFLWDDTKAAHEYRLIQARHLIVKVTVVGKDSRPIQAYFSLPEDQKQPGGGYRQMDHVMTTKELREQLLASAWKEFEYWRVKYEHLEELAEVFKAAEKLRKRKS